jgi:hypothetical protein
MKYLSNRCEVKEMKYLSGECDDIDESQGGCGGQKYSLAEIKPVQNCLFHG